MDSDLSRRGRRGVRVGVVLAVVAIVPIIGLAAFTWRAIDDAEAATVDAELTNALASDATVLAELDAAVFEEMVWRSVTATVSGFGATLEVLDATIGADPDARLAATMDMVDQLAADAGRPDVAQALSASRATELDLGGVLDEYTVIIESIEAPLAVTLGELTDSAVGARASDALVDDVEVLRLAVELRTVLTGEFYGYFSSLFDVRDAPAQEVAGLVELRQRFEAAQTLLATNPATTPEILTTLETFNSDPAVVQFLADVDVAIAEALADGLPPTGELLALPTMLENIEPLTNAMRAWANSSDLTIDLLDRAVDGVLATSADIQADAESDVRGSYVLAAVLIVASLLVALLATRFIVRPLRRLRTMTEHLQTNQDLPAHARTRGPAEVQAASRAISEAATHLDLVTRQARALSTGALDAEVLDEVAPGGLGTALQEAVGTLRSALTKQDDFRRRLAHEAAHDGMTNLANRNASLAQLTQALARTSRSDTQLAVLFIDLDRFKDVNDLHGHQAGDTVLTTAAQRIVASVREGDHVGRLGGDEFVVIAEPVTGVDEAVAVAGRILDQLNEPFELAHGRATIGASIGIALTDGDELSADELLRDADLAVYRAKEVGEGGIEICNEELRTELTQTADLTLAIRHAIEHDELLMHYQPIVDTRSEMVSAVEALVRWQRPGHEGLVQPDGFITFAERSALIIEIDRWVIAAVARQIADWKDDERYGAVPVAINISGRHLAAEEFVEHVLEPLALHGVDPRRIIIEVTESALLEDLAGAAGKLQRLRDVGIRVSIDDFGTGYTSLAHLRSLPIDIVKIDRSYIANAAKSEHEASIVKLIIDTGHLLGVTITAEGVETIDEATLLADLGSDTMQGFYFARPAAPEQAPTPDAIPGDR